MLQVAVVAPGESLLLVDGGVLSLLRARGAAMLVSCRGGGPPWTPAPDTLAWVAQAVREVPMALTANAIGQVASPIVEDALAAIADPTNDPRRITITDDAGANWSIPQPWLGRHLIAVVPCIVDASRGAGEWHGPISALLSAIAAYCGLPALAATAPIGAQIAATVFAGATIVVDAGVFLARAARSGQSARMSRIDRRLVMQALPADRTWWLDAAVALAGFLARRPDVGCRAGKVELALHGASWPTRVLEPVNSDGRPWDAGTRARRRPA